MPACKLWILFTHKKLQDETKKFFEDWSLWDRKGHRHYRIKEEKWSICMGVTESRKESDQYAWELQNQGRKVINMRGSYRIKEGKWSICVGITGAYGFETNCNNFVTNGLFDWSNSQLYKILHHHLSVNHSQSNASLIGCKLVVLPPPLDY